MENKLNIEQQIAAFEAGEYNSPNVKIQREIKFRALHAGKDGPEWVYGDLVHDTSDGTLYIIQTGFWRHNTYPVEVISGTVGQFTGLKDKDGKDIYEGDIIRLKEYSQVEVPVVFYNGAFCVHGFNWDVKRCEIVGNIHGNEDLLK